MGQVKTVLLADQNADFRETLCREINASGEFRVTDCVSAGKEVLRSFAACATDIVTMEAALPDGDGLSALRLLKQMKRDVKVILYSAFYTEAILSEAQKLGASYFLRKPFAPKTLIDRMRRASRPSLPVPRRDDALKSVVTAILHETGVPANVRGYQYLREAMLLTIENMDNANAITKRLYPAIAKKYGATSSRVERAIRHAIRIAWDRGLPATFRKYFGYTLCQAGEQPTNSEFIALIANRVLLSFSDLKLTHEPGDDVSDKARR